MHQRVEERDAAAGNRGRARPAVGLNHVAVNPNRALAELAHVHDGTQAAANQPLNFLRPAARRAFRDFALRPGIG